MLFLQFLYFLWIELRCKWIKFKYSKLKINSLTLNEGWALEGKDDRLPVLCVKTSEKGERTFYLDDEESFRWKVLLAK